ncbi:MAG: acylphosphatase [Puniceicoccales bacterium]|jgi:acylphosphatase|nr:acylphosphatase [Puniceicoccales bacterium]
MSDAQPRQVFHKDVWYSGHVQGVGFRLSVLHVSRGYEVTGGVQNLPDGRVLVQAAGDEAEVAAFLAEVARQQAAYIRSTEEREFWGETRRGGFHIIQ